MWSRRNLIRNSSANQVSRSEMTMDEYKAFFKGLMDSIPFDSSQMDNTEIWSITEQGWEHIAGESRMQQYFAEHNGGTSSGSTTDQVSSKGLTNGIETYEMMVDLFQTGGNL